MPQPDDACFGIADLRRAQTQLAPLLSRAPTMESCARSICRVLYDELRGGNAPRGQDGCALVRCFKTHRFGSLDPDLCRCGVERLELSEKPHPDLPCLTLLASYGDEVAWQSRHTSRGHRIIPIPSDAALARTPMIRELFRQFNVSLSDIGQSPWSVGPASAHAYDVFHIERALGSEHIPDQDTFVRRYGIESIVAFGGPVRRGDIYAVILFCKQRVPVDVARHVRHLALDVSANVFRFTDDAIFDRQAVSRERNRAEDVAPPHAPAEGR